MLVPSLAVLALQCQSGVLDVALGAASHAVHAATESLFGLADVSLNRNLEFTPEPVDICASLAGMRVTMVGGDHIYRLHVFLLQHSERVEGKPFPCRYPEFCTHHHICLQYVQDDVPRPRYVKPPTARQLVDTGSAAVNYIVSDTLVSLPDEFSWKYTTPFVDPSTGVRLRESYWLAAARKANVLIFGRGPLSAPGQTYTGNWSFLYHVPDYINKPGSAVPDRYRNTLVPQPLDILNAAVHLTVSRFLPDLFQLLQSIRNHVRPNRQKRLIWPSSWYRLPTKGVARSALLRSPVSSDMRYRNRGCSADDVFVLHLSALITADLTNEDPWTLLFNAQVYLQNMVLKELLPRHGILFLPLDVSWEVDRNDFENIGNTFLTRIIDALR